ncbi:MAG: ribosome biogenesis GTPase Der [Candidatus Buchananbacteria bacterium RIFCSPHIGHO2_01_FULL_47_11b]|uniref:GTPase Der n=1 Tax=Candidatus Buchananbacteria bacterium RIFCSPHIGHO2_01_FULL_47_11b TaxID=1797537 RepID=A0A1G1Y631_9BACT|nr:MAG: ribosome biogenesis GTPase Der [Candidatus Buchananbacteria bacterium RIFCSPHIGHO2_01_FULL_47_11b]
MPLPRIVIIGRTNVGKSALFNRLTESTRALVSPVAGTTRDFNTAAVEWQGKRFQLIDTGGVDVESLKNAIGSLLTPDRTTAQNNQQFIEQSIIVQTKQTINGAALLLFVVDTKTGPLPTDQQLATVLRRIKTPTLLVCNKADSPRLRNSVGEFFSFGFGQPLPVSAASGSGSGDLLDEITKRIKSQRVSASLVSQRPIRIALIGKPNVGKSSLINALSGEQRMIVSPLPQTTREPQDIEIEHRDTPLLLIDTAGLKRRSKIARGLDLLSSKKTLAVLRKIDVALLITDVSEPLGKQDARLAGLITDSGVGIIIVANKWDLLEATPKADQIVTSAYQRALPFLKYAPIAFTSALTGRSVDKILDLIVEVAKNRQTKIDQAQLDSLIDQAVQQKRPVQAKGLLRPKIYNFTQTGTNPPEFTITVGFNQSLHFSYLRFIENQLRQTFSLVGTPIRIKVTYQRKKYETTRRAR